MANESTVKTEPSLRSLVRCHWSSPTLSNLAASTLSGLDELGRDGRRILLAVPVLDRGRVLVPVGERGMLLGQHPRQAAVEHPVHVPDVTSVLEW